jgi:glycopeptide antibiotics resistance protein
VLGALPLQGGWIIQVKSHLAKLRPLLHSLLLCGPTLLFLWLVGRRPAIALALGLAILIEAAQAAFGYGFDFLDVFDLVSDVLGIAAALWVHRRLAARFGISPADQ